MRFSKTLIAVSGLAACTAQSNGSTASTSTSNLTSSASTSSAPAITLTAAPDVCSMANFDHCYDIETILTPTVYVILTVSDSASASGAEPITSGDPILTQSGNIITGTESISAPVTAIVDISYSVSSGTSCFPATITTILTDSGQTQCPQAPGEPFLTAPAQVTKTRVVIKAKDDDTQGKSSDQGNGGTAAPNGNTGTTDTNTAMNTGTAVPASSGGSPMPTDTTLPSESSSGAPTTGPSPGTPTLSTSYTTIAQVSNGTTKYVTTVIPTMTTTTSSTGASGTAGSGAGSNRIFNADFLLGAIGFVAFLAF